MKRNLLMMIALLAAMMPIQAQESVKLIFTAITADGSYSPFTYVSATNLTRGWTETLLYPDTVLVLTSSVGIGEQQNIAGLRLSEAFPNPFNKETNVLLDMPDNGETLIQLVDINGVIVASEQAYLSGGTHKLKVLLSMPSMAFLCVTTSYGRHVTRLVNTGCGGENRISVETIGAPSPCPMRGSLMGDFEPGDVMSYEAVLVRSNDSLRSEVIMQEQFTDETIVLVFPNTEPTGIIDGKFTVDANGTKVYFSQGNLQYIGSSTPPYWKFAETQWECLGNNGQGSASQNADRDLFGWGTSGWNNGNVYYQPWNTNNSDGTLYGPRGEFDLTGDYAQSDWGVYNPISNGGNMAGQWRTLTTDEWGYVFTRRSTSSGIRFAKARVAGMNGMILVPDDWSESIYVLHNTNNGDASHTSNIIDAAQWATLEDAGAVFLPTAGYRYGNSVFEVGNGGNYWSASCYIEDDKIERFARGMYFDDGYFDPIDGYDRYGGRSVRLVCPAE